MRAELHCLLVALPTQRRAFIERQHATPLGDSIRMWMQSRGHADAASLWLEYEPIAQAILACAERLAHSGVEVHLDAGAGQLRQVLATEAVVCLMAHWKGPHVWPFDVVSGVDILSALGPGARADHLLLRQLLGPSQLPGLTDPARMAAALDEIVRQQDLHPLPEAVADDTDEYRQFRNRRFIDAKLGPGLGCGNRLELWDTVLDEQRFIDCVPASRLAPVDMAVCNSAVPARRMPFDRRCVALVNRRPTGLLFRLILYEQVVGHVLRTGEDYVASALRIRALLDRVPAARPMEI